MYLARTISVKGLVQFGWKQTLLFAGLSTAVAYEYTQGRQWIGIPFQPLGTIGTAMAILLGFRNNSAYARWWEARKIWGGLVNQSRTWGMQVTSWLRPGEGFDAEACQAAHTRLVHRHVGYLNALRLQLRNQTEGWDVVKGFLSDEEAAAMDQVGANKATWIAHRNSLDLAELAAEGRVDVYRHVALCDTIEQFYELQGKAERIAKTPLPRQYSFFTTLFVWIFVLLLPFGFVKDLGWRTVPLATLLGWIFVSLEQVGRYTEDPFMNFKHDVPLTALCRVIERDLREQVGETDLPPEVQPVDNVLM